MSRRSAVALLLVGLAALFVIVVAFRKVNHDSSSAAEVHGPASQFDGAILPAGLRAPDFSLRDQHGRPVTIREYRGRPLFLTFLYSHCMDTCPVEAQQLKGALDDIGKNVPVLAISVDPPNDTPASIARFNAEQGVGDRIRWVVGSRAQLARLWKKFGVTGQTKQAEHIAHIFLVDRRGFERVGFPAQQVTPEDLAHDMNVLLKE